MAFSKRAVITATGKLGPCNNYRSHAITHPHTLRYCFVLLRSCVFYSFLLFFVLLATQLLLSPLQIFGGDIQDASLNQDVLVVAHSKGYYRMYSLSWIIEHYSVVKASLGEWVDLGGTRAGVMGEAGFGVPLTVNITGEQRQYRCVRPWCNNY